jgi:PAS domain S-box-containing protein
VSQFSPEVDEHFYRDLVVSMRNGVLAIDRNGTLVVVNDVACRILGLPSEDQYLGRHYTDVLGPRHEFAQVLSSAFALSHLPNRSELRLRHSGKIIGFTLSRVMNQFDAPTGAVLFFKDLTRVEQLEERERLRDRLAAIGEMAAAIAHEVKNPLAGIQVMAGLLKRRLPETDDDQSALNDIISEAQVANKIVVDLLEFVRPINLQIERVSVQDVLRDAVDKYEGQTSSGDVVVETAVPKDLPSVPGDHTQLRQIFTNLLINASEALNGPGRVTIGARYIASDDDLAAAGDPPETCGWVVIDVEDDGPGMPLDIREKIFSPFFTTKPRGSGLGLAIVRKIVDAHDARIDVRTRHEGGTHFQVTLRVTPELDATSASTSMHETLGADRRGIE